MAEVILRNINQQVSAKDLDEFYQEIYKGSCEKEEVRNYLFDYLENIKKEDNERYKFLMSILLLNSFKYITSLISEKDMTARSSEFYDRISKLSNFEELEQLIYTEINEFTDDATCSDDLDNLEAEQEDEYYEYLETELIDGDEEDENEYIYDDECSRGILEDMFYFNRIMMTKNNVSELCDCFCFYLLESSNLEKKMLTIFPETRTPLMIERLYYFSLIKEFSLDGLVSYYIKSKLNYKVDRIKDILFFLTYYSFLLTKEYDTIISDACREYYKYLTYILGHNNSFGITENSVEILNYIEQNDMISIFSRCNYDVKFLREIIASVVNMMAYGIYDKDNNPIPCDEVDDYYKEKASLKTKIKFKKKKN